MVKGSHFYLRVNMLLEEATNHLGKSQSLYRLTMSMEELVAWLNYLISVATRDFQHTIILPP